jgi:hypothetical protein
MNDEWVAYLQKIPGHRASHDAETNESNYLRHRTPVVNVERATKINTLPLEGSSHGRSAVAAEGLLNIDGRYAFAPQRSLASQSSPSSFSVFGQGFPDLRSKPTSAYHVSSIFSHWAPMACPLAGPSTGVEP